EVEDVGILPVNHCHARRAAYTACHNTLSDGVVDLHRFDAGERVAAHLLTAHHLTWPTPDVNKNVRPAQYGCYIVEHLGERGWTRGRATERLKSGTLRADVGHVVHTVLVFPVIVRHERVDQVHERSRPTLTRVTHLEGTLPVCAVGIRQVWFQFFVVVMALVADDMNVEVVSS